jgi:hypothetical protein
MELHRALAQVAEIQEHLSRTEVYRGYRSLPVAASGIIGLIAAALQPSELAHDAFGFVLYWTSIAAAAAIVGTSEIAYNYIVRDHALARHGTRRVVGQLLPSILGGAIITVCLVRLSPALVRLLPGIWAICFGVGIFACRPFLVRASGWVALYFYAAGVALLWTAGSHETLNAWTVGGTFGFGQLLTAAVLYWNLETNFGLNANDTQ